jgi:hypothetical protein
MRPHGHSWSMAQGTMEHMTNPIHAGLTVPKFVQSEILTDRLPATSCSLEREREAQNKCEMSSQSFQYKFLHFTFFN